MTTEYKEMLQWGDTAANLAAGNPTPQTRQLVFETDTRRFKIGDGATAYNTLPYAGGSQPTYPRLIGRFYGPSGLNSQNADANIFGTSAGVMFLTPFFVGAGGQPIDQLRQNIAAAGNGLLWMGVYGPGNAISGGMGTASRIAHASADATTTGDKILTVSATLPAGACWLAIATTDTSGTLRVLRGNINAAGSQSVIGAADASVSAGGGLKFTGQSLGSGLPATINLSSYATLAATDQGIIYVRIAA